MKMSEFASKQFINVPLTRVAVIIGKGGETKRAIESATQTTLEINSDDGIVPYNTKWYSSGKFLISTSHFLNSHFKPIDI